MASRFKRASPGGVGGDDLGGDAYASSVIFGNPSPSQQPASAYKPPSSSTPGAYGEHFLLDGSSGSKRGMGNSPGGALRAGETMMSSGGAVEASAALSPGFGSPGGVSRRGGAPLQSMLERQATASGAGGMVGGLLARSPYHTNASHSTSSPYPPQPPLPTSTSFFGSGASAAGGSGWGTDSASAGSGQQGSLGDADAAWHRWVIVSGFPTGFTGRSVDPNAFALAPGGDGRAAVGLGVGAMVGDEKEAVVQVLLRLQQFGDVSDVAPGRGNWLFVQFATPYDAMRAAAEPMTFLAWSGAGQGAMLTVTRLTADLARHADFHWAPQAGSGGSGSSGSSGSSSCGGTRYDGDSGRLHPDDGSLRRRAAGGLAGAPLGVAGGRAQALTARDDPSLMAQYLRPVKRAKSICERLLDWFYA